MTYQEKGRKRSGGPARKTTASRGRKVVRKKRTIASGSPNSRKIPSRKTARKTTATRTSQKSNKSDRINRAKRARATRNKLRKPQKMQVNVKLSANGKKEDKIPPLAADSIRIVPLGGVEEVGRNMTAFEIGNDILIVDCGFQFREDDTPGIDYILPNTKYLEDRKDKIRAILVTHGHLDHIGGIPYVIESLGNPPIYTRRLTSVMIKKRQDEFPHTEPITVHEIEKTDSIKLGDLTVGFFAVTHTIPDSMGIIIDTPYGKIVHTGDLKLDHVDGVPSKAEEKEFAQFAKENVLLLLADSTNVERPGFSFPEWKVHENLEKIIKNVQARTIIGTFASQLERVMKMVEVAKRLKKKIVIEGRSMKTNVDIVRQLKMLDVDPSVFISPDEVDRYPDNKIVMMVTGAQGDEFAALMRMANKTHKKVRIKPTDTIILSSSVVPGNERAVQGMKDKLSRQGAHIITYQTSDVHSSGHANRDETLWIHKKIGAKFFIPLHGYHYMLTVHTDIARDAGVAEGNCVIPDNSSIIEIRDGGKKIVKLKEKAPDSLRIVDGFSIGDVQEVLIRDRKLLAQDGMFVIIATINLKTGKLRKSPDIISRGFVYLRESQELLQQTRLIVKRTVETTAKDMNPINFDHVKANVTDDVSRFLYQKTNKRPIVIPVVLGV